MQDQAKHLCQHSNLKIIPNVPYVVIHDHTYEAHMSNEYHDYADESDKIKSCWTPHRQGI